MSRKLIALDLALAGLLIWAGFGLRGIWRAAKERERKELQHKTAAVPVAPLTPLPPAQAVVPQKYKSIADLFLWDRSRNADVPVEAPPPPPPEPPMPALPFYHGIMNLADGNGPTAFMSKTASSPYELVHPGETIGPFKLVSVDQKEIELEWHGKRVHKAVDELMDSSQTAAAAPAGGPQADIRAAVPVAAAPPPEPPSEKGPAQVNQFGTASCQPNDTTPFGTVRDGMRKIQRVTPFATVCLWEQVGGGR